MTILANEIKDAIKRDDYYKIQELLDLLPSGSGIDCKWEYDYNYISNSYHVMDEYGMYIGFIDFKINLDTMRLTFQTNRKGYRWIEKIMLRDYLIETIIPILTKEA